MSQTFADRWRLDANLDPLAGEILDTALALAERPLDDAEAEGTQAISASVRRAEALDAICRFFLEHREHPSASRHRPHVNVIVNAEDLDAGKGGTFADGTTVDGPSLASLVCDSVIHRLVMSGGSVILDYGTATRTISPALYNAVAIRDHHCRFPGCDRKASWCEVHHVVHVQDGGATCPSNVTLLCSRHHHRLHKTGWQAVLQPDAELVVTDPNGRVRTSRPPAHSPRPPPEMFAA
ncbi:MAG: HNH endonuclease signature motif containing protein [Acidimicrobiales bacterium]